RWSTRTAGIDREHCPSLCHPQRVFSPSPSSSPLPFGVFPLRARFRGCFCPVHTRLPISHFSVLFPVLSPSLRTNITHGRNHRLRSGSSHSSAGKLLDDDRDRQDSGLPEGADGYHAGDNSSRAVDWSSRKPPRLSTGCKWYVPCHLHFLFAPPPASRRHPANPGIQVPACLFGPASRDAFGRAACATSFRCGSQRGGPVHAAAVGDGGVGSPSRGARCRYLRAGMDDFHLGLPERAPRAPYRAGPRRVPQYHHPGLARVPLGRCSRLSRRALDFCFNPSLWTKSDPHLHTMHLL
ncbi:hypothetical protein B0H14DRAFT_3631375, partial [Mycena olivaceomarginata]